MSAMLNPRALIAEMIGVFTLVFVAGAVLVMAVGTAYYQDALVFALAPGLAILVMMAALGHVSGVHFNPAITIGLWVTRRVETVAALGYLIAQLIGGVLAALALVWLLPASLRTPANLGTPGVGPQTEFLEGVAIEAILTFFLMLTFLGTVVDRRGPRIGAVAVGLVFAMGVLVAEPLTGGGLNPARVFGPALLSGTWEMHTVYWIGPVIGAVIAALVYHFLFADDVRDPETGEWATRERETAP